MSSFHLNNMCPMTMLSYRFSKYNIDNKLEYYGHGGSGHDIDSIE